MAGWQDAPVVSTGKPKWEAAPVVGTPAPAGPSPMEQLTTQIKSWNEQPQMLESIPEIAGAAQSGAMQGMTFGFADELAAGLMTPIEMGIDAAQGKFDPAGAYLSALEQSRAYDTEAQAANPTAAAVGNIAGGIGTGLGLAQGGLTLMKGAAPTIMSMGGRGAAEGAIYGGLHGLGSGEDWQDKIAQALMGAGTGAAIGGTMGGVGGFLAGKQANAQIPSVEALKQQAGALYDQARASGLVAPQQATQQMAGTMQQIAAAEGIITPTGRVNASYPRIQGILNTMDDYATGTMEVAQAQAVRKVLTDAAKSTEPGERRVAVMMLEAFDKFLDPLAPEIATANQLYSQAMKGETIETAIELAGSRAGQFSGSGFENALRTEFRALDRAIIKGEMRGLTQAEIEAIKKVANGGPLENIARWIGKAAPTGIVSMGAGFGVPFAIGSTFGSPALGTAMGLGTMGAGMAGREAATALTRNNANIASMLARTGGQAPQVSPAIQQVMQALIAAQGTQAPKIPEALRAMALN